MYEDYLLKMLNVKPGSVTPFGLLNDTNNLIDFYLDEKITKFSDVNFHPMINTSTLNIRTNDFISFMFKNNKVVKIFNFDNILLTPHNAALTLECRKRMSVETCENITHFLNESSKLNVSNIVNKSLINLNI